MNYKIIIIGEDNLNLKDAFKGDIQVQIVKQFNDISKPCYILMGNDEISRLDADADKQTFFRWLGKHVLSNDQFNIAFHETTQTPFQCALLDEKRKGVFVDILTGQPLFLSQTKYDSGSGWTSFFDTLPDAITTHTDNSLGRQRAEIKSKSSTAHLGHVFDDGPPPTNKRYCINGDILRFIEDSD